MIKLTNISKIYEMGDQKLEVLKHINLEIRAGEFAAILGPSGSGKSTLMHIIGLLDKPSEGKVFIEKNDVSKLSDEQLSHLRNRFAGFVFQQFNLLNKYTVLENVTLPALYSRDNLNFDPQKKGLELLSRLMILDKAHTYPNKLSGGQQQRVAIARALIMNPKIILADEPTGNLDTKTGQAILEILHSLNKKDKITIIIVTHDANIASKAKRKIKIVDGKITR